MYLVAKATEEKEKKNKNGNESESETDSEEDEDFVSQAMKCVYKPNKSKALWEYFVSKKIQYALKQNNNNNNNNNNNTNALYQKSIINIDKCYNYVDNTFLVMNYCDQGIYTYTYTSMNALRGWAYYFFVL